MDHYNPLIPPDPEVWLSMDEVDRLHLVMEYHGITDTDLPNEKLHTTIQTIVENQVAMREETPVAATLKRLQHDGLNRHEAIHAVGRVFLYILWEFRQSRGRKPSTERYYGILSRLTVEGWDNTTDRE